jgi:hypothetical protein
MGRLLFLAAPHHRVCSHSIADRRKRFCVRGAETAQYARERANVVSLSCNPAIDPPAVLVPAAGWY